MFGVNISALLDSLDTVAKETLEEPKESATRIRSKRKQAASQAQSQSSEKDLSVESSTRDIDEDNEGIEGMQGVQESVHTPTSNIATGLPLDESSTHSNRTQESYVIPGSMTSNSLHGSEDATKETLSTERATAAITDSVPVLASTIAAASKLIVPNMAGVISRKSSNTLLSAPTEVSSVPATASQTGNEAELRKQLRSKAKEIESLNEECLELEEKVAALTQEVQEAWDHYKSAQEKAASRESELQDEITLLQKAKMTDKQNATGQIAKLNEDIELILQQLQQVRDEKQHLVAQMAEQENIHASYEAKIQGLEEELKEARINSMQGAHHLREELKQLQIQREQMTSEHNRLLKQLQSRQSQLEQENAQLGMTVTNMQQELLRTKNSDGTSTGSGQGNTNEDYMNREIVALRQELTTLQNQFNLQADQKQTLEVQLRQLERDNRVLQMTHDEYRQRSQETELKLQRSVQQLETQLSSMQQANKQSLHSSSSDEYGGFSGGGGDQIPYKELKQQVEHLSKMLMKKQSDLIDVTAERTTLKSKILDLQAKCSSLETQLSQLKDLEDGDDDYGDDYAGGGSTATNFQRGGQDRLMQRRGRGGNGPVGGGVDSTKLSNAKVISDLEKFGVKPNASVTKAVTAIDTLALCTGKFLRSNPLIRLAFVLYLILLHLWVFFILVIHTHALELPADPRDRVQNKIFKAPMVRSISST